MDNLLWPALPKSVDKLVKHIKSNAVDNVTLVLLTDFAVNHWNGTGVTKEQWDEATEDLHLSRNMMGEVYAGLLTVALMVNRLPEHRVVQPKLRAELEGLSLPPNIVEKFMNCRSLERKGPTFPHIDSTKWRVDVVISSSSVGRILEPSILLELICDTGVSKQIYLSLQQFHSLRCRVASALQNLNEVM